MKDITKKYSNGEITIIWKPATCMHSTVCWKAEDGLPDVFNPAEKPWIKPEAATTDRIIQQIKKCPSGALSFYYNNEENPPAAITSNTKIEVMKNGPLLVYGNLAVTHKNGEVENKNKVTAFCRCGKSSSKPYCDGSHISSGFEG